MNNQIFRDELWLVCSLLKWCFFSIIAGVIVGTAAGWFLLSLDWSINKAASLGWLHYVLLFPALLFSYYFVRFLAPEAAGHGTEKVIEALHPQSRGDGSEGGSC